MVHGRLASALSPEGRTGYKQESMGTKCLLGPGVPFSAVLACSTPCPRRWVFMVIISNVPLDHEMPRGLCHHGPRSLRQHALSSRFAQSVLNNFSWGSRHRSLTATPRRVGRAGIALQATLPKALSMHKAGSSFVYGGS